MALVLRSAALLALLCLLEATPVAAGYPTAQAAGDFVSTTVDTNAVVGAFVNAPTMPGAFAALPPQRLLDTRNSIGGPKAPVTAGSTITLHVTGQGPTGNKIPDNISAVAINITATRTTNSGYLTAYPDLTTRPGTSTLGYSTGTTTANFAIVPVGTNGNIDIYNGGPGTTDIIGDVAGYYLTGTPTQPGAFAAVPPQRLLDTRNSIGGPKAPVTAGSTITLHVTGQGPTGNKIPDNISAIAINITATRTTNSGYLTAYPDLTNRPGTSTLGYSTGTTTANFAIVPVGTNGNIDIYNGGPGTTDIIGDVAGYYLTGTPTQPGAFAAVPPQRLLDTRNSIGGPKAPVTAGSTITLHVTGQGPTGNKIPDNISAIAINITATRTTNSGYLTAYPDLTNRPGTSTLGYSTGTTTANFAIVPVGTNGNIDIYNGGPGTTDIIGDVAGYFLAQPPDIVAPGPVTGLSVSNISSTGLVLKWTNPGGDFQGVMIRRNVGSTAPSSATQGTLVADVSAGTSTFADSDLNSATTYSYALFAHDAVPNYATAAKVSATTTASTTNMNWDAPTAVDALHGAPTAVSCPSTTFCAAVDSMGNAILYQSGWGKPVAVDAASAQAGGLTSISCLSGTFCVAVDAAGNALRYDGTSWSSAGAASTLRLNSVSCFSTTFCVAVGSGGVATTFTGSSWTAKTTTTSLPLAAVSCTATNFCAAVEIAGRVIIWNGSSWSAPRALDSKGSVTAVDCVSTAFCVAVDAVQNSDFSTTGHAVTFTSTATSTPVVADSAGGLASISCTGSGACRAADDTGAVVTLSSGQWTRTTTDGGPFTAISCPTGSSCTALDAYGSAVPFNGPYGGTPVSVDVPNTLTSLSCTSATFCTAVDVAGQAVGYNGTGWATPVVADNASGLNGVSCVSSTFCTAVGLVDAVTYGGTGWTASRTIAPGSFLTTVSCRSTTFCVTTGDDGSAVVLKNGTWSAPNYIDEGQSLNSVSCASATFCVAVDDAGRAFTYNGTAWAGPVVADGAAPNNSLVSVSCPTTSFCVAVDVGGSAVRYNGTSWSAPVSITSSTPTSVSCSSAARCVAVDTAGNAMAFDGTKWAAPVSIDPGSAFLGGLTEVSCPTDTFCMAIDQAGQAVRGSR